MRYLLLSLLFAVSIFPAHAANPPINNAGFVQSNIWYSKDPFYAGDKIRIYTVIFNGSAYDLSGLVEFLDNGSPIGAVRFSISSGGRIQDLWTNWTATAGKHTITARFVDVVADGPEGKHAVFLANTEAGKNERVVDLDPATKEAQAKAEALRAEEKRAEITRTVESVVEQASDVIPQPVKEGVAQGTTALEEFRLGEAYQFKVAKEEKLKEIAALSVNKEAALPKEGSGRSEDSVEVVAARAEKPLAYVMVAILATLQYFFEWSVLFYGVLFYVTYRLLRWGIEKIRNR